MNIFTDGIHHADLAWSLILLGDRLGATVYFPYGMEWFDQGYYSIYGDLRKKDPYRYLAKKYLVDNYYPTDYVSGHVLVTKETYNGCVDYPTPWLLTLEQAQSTPIDIIICTLHENEETFAKLKEFWPNAKFIRQVGNDLDTIINAELYPNLLASAKSPFQVFTGHKILYKQEFPLDLFKYQEPTHFNNIYSFQNNLENFEDTYKVWMELKHELKGFSFKSYGNENDDGKIYPKRKYIEKMLESTFGFQSKGPWEGYGHTIFNSYCLGRPMIVREADYKGKMAEPLLIKDETFIDMDDPELADKIRYYSEPGRFKTMSDKCRQMFNEVVDFEVEGKLLKTFFQNLV